MARSSNLLTLVLAGALLGGSVPPLTPTAQANAETADPAALQQAETLNQQVLELYDAGRYAEAIPLAEEALVILREQLGDRDLEVAVYAENLAVLYEIDDRNEAAATLYEEVLAIFTERLGEQDIDVAYSLENLARVNATLGHYQEAEKLHLRSLPVLRDQLGNQHLDVATSLNNFAEVYRQLGRYGEAEALLKESLSIFRSQLGESHPEVASGQNNLAVLYLNQGRYPEAESLLQQSIVHQREQLGSRHPDVALSLNNLAEVYRVQGRYDEAETRYREAYDIWREVYGEEHPDVALSLTNLAALYRDQGLYTEAASLFQDALEIWRKHFGDRHPNVALSLNNLGLLYTAQGRYEEAELLQQEALSIMRESLGDNHPSVALSLNNLATLYLYQDETERVEPLLTEAIEILRGQLGDRHPDVATSLVNLAELYTSQERYAEAEPLYQESLLILQGQFGDRHPNVAINQVNLAGLYEDQQRFAEAESLRLESLAIFREQLGDLHPYVSKNLTSLALMYQEKGEIQQAVRYLEESLDIEEWNLSLNLSALAEIQRQNYSATLSSSTSAIISFSVRSSDREMRDLGLTTLLRRKGRLLEAGANTLQRLRQNVTAADREILDELNATRRTLATLTFNPPFDLGAEQYQTQLRQLEAKVNDLEEDLARQSALYRGEFQPVDIEAVRSQIPDNAVIIEYARYHSLTTQSNPDNDWEEARYAAYLLFPDGQVEAIDLGSAAEIDEAVQAFTVLLQDVSIRFQTPDASQVTDAADRMSSLVLEPLMPYLMDREHLLISPDGQLNRLPFEALQLESGEDYLVQQYQISYLNSGRDLLKFDLIEPSSHPAVVVANPDYDAAENAIQVAQATAGETRGGDRRSAELSQLVFGPLPGTAAEVEAIRPHLPNAQILTRAEATENALKQVQSPRILHIATHGFFLADLERPTGDVRGLGIVAIDGAVSPASVPIGVGVENPLLRSGLALAGFNQRQSGREDGVLTALEASTLNLLGTQLVVLSACETGLGDITNGEGVYGLRRAFALAGAESQLMSLWQVSDFGTQSLMAQYYENLAAGMGRSEALRAAQLEMIEESEEYSHPFYWAAFILTGDWRPL